MSSKPSPDDKRTFTGKRVSRRKNRWEAEASDLRIRRILSNLAFWVSILIIITLIGVIITQQLQLTSAYETVQEYEDELQAEIELTGGGGLAFTVERRPSYMLDELAAGSLQRRQERPTRSEMRNDR